MQKGTRVRVKSPTSHFDGLEGEVTRPEPEGFNPFVGVELDAYPEWKGEPTFFFPGELEEVA